ncbi:MAG: RNA methyltransferase [Victivallales bacterium]|nr:RNA methyltransferase [Victivallales bacterium]
MIDPKPNSVEVRLGDRENPREEQNLPLVIVLDMLRSAHNTGNIFRLADAVRAREILACGYTPCPPHPKLAKTAMGCDEFVPCRHFDRIEEALAELRSQGYTIYGVDTVVGARCYWDAPLKFPAALVLGNEALGISREALEMCDGFIQLPAAGQKNSINVGNCAAVVLFEALRQYRQLHGNDFSIE